MNPFISRYSNYIVCTLSAAHFIDLISPRSKKYHKNEYTLTTRLSHYTSRVSKHERYWTI